MTIVHWTESGIEKRMSIDATGKVRIERLTRDRGPTVTPTHPRRYVPDGRRAWNPGRTHLSHKGEPDPADLTDPDLLARAAEHKHVPEAIA